VVFKDQNDMLEAFKNGELNKDCIVVVRFQGPAANGMPELHKLTPSLGVLQDKGFKVALVTDGRMSGASGKVPAAIHIVPEAAHGGPIARIRDGDVITLDVKNGKLSIDVEPEDFDARPLVPFKSNQNRIGFGRDLFGAFRQHCGSAEAGAGVAT
jgi:phosphogluconate dehydratase